MLNVGLPVICLTGQKPPIVLQDSLRSTTVVPASGAYEWHVNQSTRPFVGAAGGTEAYELRCMSATGETLETRTVTIARGQDVTLNLGCGGGAATTLGDGRKLAPSTTGGGAIGPPPSVDGIRAALSAVAGRKLAKPKRRQQHPRAQVRGLHAQRDAAGQRGEGAGGAARVRAALRAVAAALRPRLVPGCSASVVLPANGIFEGLSVAVASACGPGPAG